MNPRGLPEIPWIFTDASGLLMWSWVTAHFAARIQGRETEDPLNPTLRNVVSYRWELLDLMRTHQGVPRQLVEGTSGSFAHAEQFVREHVGKCYDLRLGYMPFAGALALTFTLATGEMVDVTALLGTRCAVTVLGSDGTTRTVAGDFAVDHYRWRIDTPSERLQIVPEHVTRITNRSEIAEMAFKVVQHDAYTGVGRMYREEPGPGCSGRPGFTIGTVDHAGAARCPVHESGLAQDSLR
ncbi:MAG: hypothetical protein Q8L05_04100 [Actinomycetota bacterium]|nr:hypothetical protein [Actinomycetota bacterium]MDP2289403.1 hypothetical protein [Actinomycetota bacterium]